ncbi:InlB B-repeat-containing protein [Pseudoflavonifractor sp. An184]|uniref:InlB B-repeat-containing protein n=1 Tax=Pseudoflavonifractor sp. An184 TaxID=1965576 RepID=UPI000B37AB2E|nr:InlB B-repeat-containing protein [Pseudoflavonifractor sp. An184]OUP56934.1 hypothetical protein B5F19_05335 [Pseudoflavonifractor sp. An184]
MKQKLLASAMALAMVLSLTPVTALAAEGEDTTLPEEEITVQTETPVEEPVQLETEIEEPTEPEIPAEELVPADEIPVEEPAEPESATEETDSAEPVQPETAEEPVEVETAVPTISDIEISNVTDSEVVNGSYIFTAPLNSAVTSYVATVTLSDGAVFTPTTPTTPNTGDLYVEEVGEGTATLKFNLNVGGVDISADQFALILEETGDNKWTGGFENAAGLSLETLAGYLVDQDIQLAAGALGAGSEAQQILVNQDAEDVMLALCAPNATVYTVDYVVDEDTTITWKLPAGAEIREIAVELSGGQEIEGWYTNADCTNSFVVGTTVTGNTTLYAKVDVPATDKTFLEKLEDHDDVTIYTKTEWDTFVENSDVVVAGQLITLGADIDCNNTTYDSMTFKGNFNGNGKTISNATFRAVDSAYYTSSESDIVCSGMFAALGAGQIVANLTLDNITAQYASTYSAPLAGLADGTSSQRVLIQNVQVRNSSASGRTAAGVVGFTRNTTVRFCSSRNTTITGLANGGGIVGINNARVEFCYSTTSPTALPSIFGGSTGGVVSKNVRGGYADTCWATMVVVGASDSGGTNINILDDVDPDSTESSAFEAAGFNASGEVYWNLADGDETDFIETAVEYQFTDNN